MPSSLPDGYWWGLLRAILKKTLLKTDLKAVRPFRDPFSYPPLSHFPLRYSDAFVEENVMKACPVSGK